MCSSLRYFRLWSLTAVLVGALFSIAPAHAQWAVVDVGAIGQLVREVQTLEQELQTARDTLQQARDTYDSLHGTRGMAQLLSGVTRNYLPGDWTQINALLSGASGAYGVLSSTTRASLLANSVLTAPQLARLSTANQQQIVSQRQLGALRQTLAQQALAGSSARFASMQALIDAISTASDPKAILDLQGRIGGELGMLQNEQIKLNALDQTMRAQESVYRQQQQESAVAADGNFALRLQPTF